MQDLILRMGNFFFAPLNYISPIPPNLLAADRYLTGKLTVADQSVDCRTRERGDINDIVDS